MWSRGEDNVVKNVLSSAPSCLYDRIPLAEQREISLSESPPGAMRRPTMQDVAALAGVALKTVSRVVNAEPGVSPALEARVRRAIEQLNYRRDANASMLRRLGRKTQTIRLRLPGVSPPLSSPPHR